MKKNFEIPPESDGERHIKTTLDALGVKYIQEQELHNLKGDTKKFRRSDFFLPEYDIYLEYNGGFNEKSKQRYQEKTEIYKKNNIRYIEIKPIHLNNISYFFKKKLIEHGEQYKSKYEDVKEKTKELAASHAKKNLDFEDQQAETYAHAFATAMHDFKYSEEDTKKYAELYVHAIEIGYNEEEAVTFAKELTENSEKTIFKIQNQTEHELTEKQISKSINRYIETYVKAIHELGYNNQQAEMHAMHEVQNKIKQPLSTFKKTTIIAFVLTTIINGSIFLFDDSPINIKLFFFVYIAIFIMLFIMILPCLIILKKHGKLGLFLFILSAIAGKRKRRWD